MVIWRGWGLVMIVPVIAGYSGTYLLTEIVASDPDYFWKHVWIRLVGTLVAVYLTRLSVKIIDWRTSSRLVVDTKSGEVLDLGKVEGLSAAPSQLRGLAHSPIVGAPDKAESDTIGKID